MIALGDDVIAQKVDSWKASLGQKIEKQTRSWPSLKTISLSAKTVPNFS